MRLTRPLPRSSTPIPHSERHSLAYKGYTTIAMRLPTICASLGATSRPRRKHHKKRQTKKAQAKPNSKTRATKDSLRQEQGCEGETIRERSADSSGEPGRYIERSRSDRSGRADRSSAQRPEQLSGLLWLRHAQPDRPATGLPAGRR